MTTPATCERCSKAPCRCVYMPIPLVALPMRDDDIDRIAERVIAKLTAMYEPPVAKEPT